MLKKKIIIPTVTFLAFSITLAILLIGHDDIVINYGIRAYTTMRMALIVTTVVSAVWMILSIVYATKQKPSNSTHTIDIPDKNKLTESDRAAIYKELATFATTKWKQITAIQTLLNQLNSMNEYQKEMEQLLRQNDYLEDKPTEIVQRIEDCMYVNLQKLINYMRIVQTKDIAAMASKTDECVEKNTSLLDKTDDFIIHLVDYVNDDMARGEEEKTKDYVDSYMFVVLNAIDLPETYLK